MNRADAKKLAETLTTDQLKDMFKRAKENISDWEQVSSVNKGMTIGATWNILANCNAFDSQLARTNMIREFGDYLDENIKPKKVTKKLTEKNIFHQSPDLSINLD